MTKEKNENNIIELRKDTYLPLEIMREIFTYTDDSLYKTAKEGEPKSVQSSLALTGSMFGHIREFQDDRIKAKLGKHISVGRLEMVDSLLTIRPDLSCHALFVLAGFACQDKMQMILEKDLDLFRVYAPIKDISGVYPVINDESKVGITVFQHAIWAGDVRYMCNMMLDCLPNNEKGEEIRVELARQCEELMEKGVVYYDLNGNIHKEKQFSLQPLIDALTTYVNNYNNWTYEERCSNWCNQVGLSQTLVPAHIRHHYCDAEESFLDKPTFCKEKFTRSLTFYNYIQSSYQLWNESLVGLGFKFGITWRSTMGSRTQRCAQLDLTAIEALCKVRTEDLLLLIQRLQNPIQNLEKDKEPMYTVS